MVDFITKLNTSDRLPLLNRKCFSCFNKYKIVGKGWVKCTKVRY